MSVPPSPTPRRAVFAGTALAAFLTLGACVLPPRIAPGDALPTPYTAAEIQAANPPGSARVSRLEKGDAPVLLQTFEFLSDDGASARIRSTTTNEAGEVVAEVQEGDSSWTELRDHALFPAVDTVRERASCTVTAGTFECWLYERAQAGGEEPDTIHRFWFADELPGPPVLYEATRDGAIEFRMELIERVLPAE